jgi:hypothetical protein
MPSFPGNVYDTIQTFTNQAQITTSTSMSSFGIISITASSFPNFSSCAAAFDQYRILQLEILLEPWLTENNAAATNPGQITTVIDYDDQSVPSSIATLNSYANAIVSNGTQKSRRCFKPRIAVAAYAGAFTSYANLPSSTWIDCASSSVQYYGEKFGMTATTAIENINLVVRAHFQFRCGR